MRYNGCFVLFVLDMIKSGATYYMVKNC